MRPVYSPHLAKTQCEHCGAPVGEEARICNASVCQTKAKVIAAQETAASVRAAIEQRKGLAARRTRKLLRTAARRAGAENLGKIAYAIVPHVRGETATRPEDKDRKFIHHLETLISEAFSEPPEGGRAFPNEEPPDADFFNWAERGKDEPLALSASCIACQGDCCFWGEASNAFLTPNTIAWFRHQHPNVTAQDVYDAYSSRVPKESISGSCVYHGAEGCTLPRNMRAEICNRWQCSYRLELGRQIAMKGSGRAVVAGLPRDHYQRPEAGGAASMIVSIDPESGVRVHDDLTLPALRLPKDQ